MLKDRRPRDVIKYRIAVGHPGDIESKRGPTELDHFVVTTMERDRQGFFTPAPELKIDAKCRRLEFFVDSDDIADFVRQEYVCTARAGGRVVRFCTGDGVEARRLVGDGEWRVLPCRSAPRREDGSGWKDRLPLDLVPLLKNLMADDPSKGEPMRCPFAQNTDTRAGPSCKPTTEMLVRLAAAPGGISGFARYRSHGHRTADQIVQSLERIREVTGGVLRGVPLALVAQRVSMRRPDGKSATHTTVHVELAVEPSVALRAAMQALQSHGRLLHGVSRARALLDAPRGHEGDVTEADEFGDVAEVEVLPAAPVLAPVLEAAAQDEERPSGSFAVGDDDFLDGDS